MTANKSPALIDLQWFASAEDEGRTEKPSEYKLKKAREEGRVLKSQELIGAIGLLLPSVTLLFLAPSLIKTMREMVTFFFLRVAKPGITTDGGILVQACFSYFIKLTLPLALVAVVSALASNILQVGFQFSMKPITPDFSKIVPHFGQYMAEGDIVVHQGINAKSGGLVQAGKNVWAKFVENAFVEAGENIVVSDGIVNTTAVATKKIICQGKRASLVGGRYRACEEINVKNLGSPVGGAETVLEVGYDPKSKEKMDQLKIQGDKLDKQRENLDKNIATLNAAKKQKGSLPEDKEAVLQDCMRPPLRTEGSRRGGRGSC